MAVLITASHLWILSSAFLLKFTSADTTIVTAVAAQNVTLPCQAPNNNIRVLQWSRDGLKAEDIFVYRNKMVDRDNQHQSFKNRVDLQDRQMKDGDASLILSNVTINDNGTYKCHVFMEETRSWKVSSIYLRVVNPPGQTGGHTEDGGKEAGGETSTFVGLKVGLSICAVLLVAAVAVFLIYRKLNKQNQDSY